MRRCNELLTFKNKFHLLIFNRNRRQPYVIRIKSIRRIVYCGFNEVNLINKFTASFFVFLFFALCTYVSGAKAQSVLPESKVTLLVVSKKQVPPARLVPVPDVIAKTFETVAEEAISTISDEVSQIAALPAESRNDLAEKTAKDPEISKTEAPAQTPTAEKFHWKGAIGQSLVFLGFQHSMRLVQEKTTREFKGPFFRDWGSSVKGLKGWEDGDNFFTNYIAHPFQGSVTGRIFINNSDIAKKQEISFKKAYWESRFKALAWSAVWSTQFELGLLGEAAIGNVGKTRKNGKTTMGYVDLVITPTAGTGLVILEDLVDRYLLKNFIEPRVQTKMVRRILRFLFTPTTGFANMLRWRVPWYRDTRTL